MSGSDPSEKKGNSSWCPLPWMSVSLRNNGDYRVCCHANTSSSRGILKDSEGRIHNGKSSGIDEVRNSALLKEVRAAMLRGERHEMCVRCNREDDSGVRSRRQYEADIWEREFGLEESLRVTKPDGSIDPTEVSVLFYDVRFGNLCNLKCRMCGPTDSSAWYEEYYETVGSSFNDTHGRVKLERPASGGKPIVAGGENPYGWYEHASFWAQVEGRMSEIRRIHTVGGEPLLIDQHYELLQKIIDAGHANKITIEYNSNILQIPQRAWDIWKHFREIRLGASIDGYGKINDYIRHPSKWAIIEKNLDRLDQAEGNFDVWISCTVQLFNIHYLTDFFRWKIEKNFKKINAGDVHPFTHTHPLHTPIHLNIKVLPPAVKERVREKFRRFYSEWFRPYVMDSAMDARRKDLWLAKMSDTLSAYENLMMKEDLSHHLPDFWRITEATDRYRGESFMETMPEIAEPIRDFLVRNGKLPGQ